MIPKVGEAIDYQNLAKVLKEETKKLNAVKHVSYIFITSMADRNLDVVCEEVK